MEELEVVDQGLMMEQEEEDEMMEVDESMVEQE